MTFLTSNPDLSNTIYDQQSLDDARLFFSEALKEIDPNWINKPVGPLKIYWELDSPYATCYLISLYQTVNRIQRWATLRSKKLVVQKFNQLLRASSDKEFDAVLTELQVGDILTNYFRPISFEPFVAEEGFRAPNKPKSPDYAIKLSDGFVVIEVTTLFVRALEIWDKNAVELGKLLRTQLKSRNVNRIIDAEFPLSLESVDKYTPEIKVLAEIISDKEAGTWTMKAGNRSSLITWKPFPIVIKGKEPPEIKNYSSFVILPDENTQVRDLFTFNYNLSRGDHREIFTRSLRNTLKTKRRQFPHEAAYILVVKLGHHRMNDKVLEDVVIRRIWPNPDYAWMTGICLYTPGRLFQAVDPPPNLRLILNPNTRNQPPKDFIDSINRANK